MPASSRNAYLLGKDAKIIAKAENLIELDVIDGDIAINSYAENIIASINRRLFSRFEELILHKEYGGFIGSYVSEISTLKFINLMLFMMQNEILKDPRITEVVDISVELTKDQRRVMFSYSIKTISRQQINNAVFEIGVL